MKMLGGWTRLLIGLSVLYGIPVAYFAYSLYKDRIPFNISDLSDFILVISIVGFIYLFVPCVIIYILGWSVVWAIRRFKR